MTIIHTWAMGEVKLKHENSTMHLACPSVLLKAFSIIIMSKVICMYYSLSDAENNSYSA